MERFLCVKGHNSQTQVSTCFSNAGEPEFLFDQLLSFDHPSGLHVQVILLCFCNEWETILVPCSTVSSVGITVSSSLIFLKDMRTATSTLLAKVCFPDSYSHEPSLMRWMTLHRVGSALVAVSLPMHILLFVFHCLKGPERYMILVVGGMTISLLDCPYQTCNGLCSCKTAAKDSSILYE